MKNQIAAFLATALVASMALAQNTSTATMPSANSGAAQGIRVSLVKSMLDAEVKASAGGQSMSVKDTLDEVHGLSVGYASLPVQAIGWTANVTYFEVKNDDSNGNVIRADGNAAYAISNLVNFKGGLNLSKMTGSGTEDFKPAIGMQASVGLQFTKNFGLDLGYTQMNQTADQDGVDVKFKMSGFEVGVNGTF